MSDDIVARLRETEGGYTLRGILREAADEIERLRQPSGNTEQLPELDIVARLRVLGSEFPTLDRIMDCEWTNAANEIARLRLLLASSRQQVEQLTALMREWARADSDCMKANAPTIESFNRLMSAEHAMRYFVGMPGTEKST